ncbi:MAG: hypothetical protein AAB845_01215 [Patescibacteria group bacterium]
MAKLLKIKRGYFVFGVVILLVGNYQLFNKAFKETTEIETTDEMVARILFKNGIQVTSLPGVYNIKDTHQIDVSLNSEMREKAELYDQILYYKPENILVLYRPSTKSIITATSLAK